MFSIRQLLPILTNLGLLVCNWGLVDDCIRCQLAKALSLLLGLGAISLATSSLWQSIRYSAARGNWAGSASSWVISPSRSKSICWGQRDQWGNSQWPGFRPSKVLKKGLRAEFLHLFGTTAIQQSYHHWHPDRYSSLCKFLCLGSSMWHLGSMCTARVY